MDGRENANEQEQEQEQENAQEQEHIVTATEPAWVTCKYRPEHEADGAPVYVGNSTDVEDAIDGMFQESVYECSCGADLGSWYDVQEHFNEVVGPSAAANANANANGAGGDA